MKKVFGLIISAALIFGAVPAVYAAEEPAQAEAAQEETFSITAAGCIAFKGDEALEENKAPAGTELTFKLEKDLAENEGLSWAVQFSDGSEFEDFKESEDGKSITLAMPEKDIIVTAQIGEIIESDEADTSGMNFSDVKESDWFYGAVKEMFEGNYMGGTSDSKYEPQAEGKRSEIVTVLYRLDGSQKAEGELKFSDITKNTELADAAVWASQCGIAAGYPDGTFKPDQSVSRQELAIFIYKYAQYKGLDTSVKGDLNIFKDKGDIADWSKEAVTWAVGSGLISGMGDGTMAPKGTTTRAQLASLFNRLRKLDPVVGDPSVDEQLFANMPLGKYESKEMAREVTVFADGTYEMIGGHGVENPEPFKGTWEAKTIDLGNEMMADGVYFYENGEELMYWIYDDHETFIVGPWEGKDALYEHMVRTEKPEMAVEGTWLAPAWDGTGINKFVFENGKWQAVGAGEKAAASGTYAAVSGEVNTYKLVDTEGKAYDEVVTFFNDFGTCLYFRSTGDYFVIESAVKG